jgi:DNA repair exonuclease SbcCD ATPase subunit
VLEQTKNANKDEIKRLREDNKDLRKKLAQLTKTAMNQEQRDEIKFVEGEVAKLRKQYDDLKIRASRYRKELDQLKDSVKDLELDSQRPHMEDNEHTRRIRALENKLDKAMIKYNEAQSIRKTYEQIVRRLNEERVGFDNQLSAIERTVAAKKRDHAELLLLAGDANYARETALTELERVRAMYEEQRKKREKELREQHQAVSLRRMMLERIKHREKLRNDLIDAKTNPRPLSPEQELRNSQSMKTLMLEKLESRNKVNIFENAFRKIKEATGVSDVNEVIQKIISQESTTENLINVTRENQAKMEALNEMKKKIKLHCEELKYSGVGGGQHRKMVDSYEDQLSNASTRLERSRLKYERLNKIVIAMKAGVGHLQDKLEAFREEIGGKSYIIADETVADSLHEADLCYQTLIKRIKAGEDEMKRAHMFDTTYSSQPQSASSTVNFGRTNEFGTSKGAMLTQMDLLDIDDQVANLHTLRPYNQRIDLNATDDPNAADAFGGNDDLGDLDDDELTREKVKRASTQILNAMDKKKKKNGKKKGPHAGGGHAGVDDESVNSGNKSPFRNS